MRSYRALANGVSTAYTYGNMRRLARIAVGGPGGTLWAQRYGFNAAGERVFTLEGSTGTTGDAYQLDATGQHRRLGSREVDSASAEPPAWRRRDERERASQLTGVKYRATGADAGYASAVNPAAWAIWTYDAVCKQMAWNEKAARQS